MVQSAIVKERNYAGLSILALSTGIAIGWASALIVAAINETNFTPAGLNVLTAIGSGMIGIIGAYIGSHIRHRNGRNGNDRGG